MESREDFERRLRKVKRELLGDGATIGRLEALTAVAKLLIANCDGAGFALEATGGTQSVGTTDDVVVEVDLVQYDTGEGPCLDAIMESNVVRIDILEPGGRWAHFAPGALDLGIHSVLSLPVVADGTTVGALNLYAATEHAFDDDAERMGSSLASYAADVISQSGLYAASRALVDAVLEELGTREVVNTAVGLLVGRLGCDEQAAYQRLVEQASERGSTVREAAEWELREQQLRDADASSQRPPADRGPEAA